MLKAAPVFIVVNISIGRERKKSPPPQKKKIKNCSYVSVMRRNVDLMIVLMMMMMMMMKSCQHAQHIMQSCNSDLPQA